MPMEVPAKNWPDRCELHTFLQWGKTFIGMNSAIMVMVYLGGVAEIGGGLTGFGNSEKALRLNYFGRLRVLFELLIPTFISDPTSDTLAQSNVRRCNYLAHFLLTS